MDNLTRLEQESIYIIREAYARFRNSAVLWSVGKDSTVLLWLMRKAFFGSIPFPVVHIDTSYKFKEIYSFRNTFSKKWNLNLIIVKNDDALHRNMNKRKSVLACCHALKTDALKQTIKAYGFNALYLAIRRDEHGIRAKERLVSPRNAAFEWNYANQPPELWSQFVSSLEDSEHARVHPLLNWTEYNVWEYIKRECIPVVSLYFSRWGKRYRSIGCKCCCQAVKSKAKSIDHILAEIRQTNVSERSGRAHDKESEYVMQKLRSLGYM